MHRFTSLFAIESNPSYYIDIRLTVIDVDIKRHRARCNQILLYDAAFTVNDELFIRRIYITKGT